MTRVLPTTVRWLNNQMERHSQVGTDPFLNRDAFPWSRELETNWRAIRNELDAVLSHRAVLPNFQDISTDQRRLTNDDNWKTYFFYAYGHRFAGNIERCPQTAEQLARVPGLTTAFFSILAPGKHIPPHRANYRGVVRYHLGLKIPSPDHSCGIRVGGQTAHWSEGGGMFFDDTYEHEAWNNANTDRAVLFMDILRPVPLPYSLVNRAVIKAIARSPMVQEARGNQDAWEQRFEQLLAGG